jgi:hypothetical protein
VSALSPMVHAMTLRLDWCSHAAAKYAVEHWHYSRSLPTPPLVKIGVWEDDKYIGAVLFSRGANNNLGRPYGLPTVQVCELTRVALAQHKTPVSRIVAIAIKMLRKACDGLRLCVSFADPNEQHVGTIYQAGGWVYVGATPPSQKYIDKHGREWHQRQVSVSGVKPQYGQLRHVAKISECVKVPQLGKLRYLMPLDAAMRAQIEPLRKPYPKRATSIVVDAPTVQAGEGGAVPTVALQLSEAR